MIYPVTRQGIGAADTIHIGSVYDGQAALGFIKPSPNGRKLAASCVSTQPHAFDLFDFDAASGKLSNYINLGNLRLQYGVSFSPDNTKLYITNRNVVNTAPSNLEVEYIRQYDLSSANPATIIALGKSIIYQNPATNFPPTTQGQR